MNYESNNPQVSVILPTYNRAHLIKRSIQSVLDQTFQDFEIIVVDDGSSDNTEEQVKSFNNQKIRYIRYNENKGAAFARNTGIKAAQGEYIAFQDSDDEWFPNKLRRQMEVFKNSSPAVGVVYTGSWRIRNDKRFYLPLFKGGQREGNIYKALFEDTIIGMPTPAFIVKKECFGRAGLFDERLYSLIDWELWLRISKYYEFRYIDEPLVTLYGTQVSITTDLNSYIEARKLILKKHFKRAKKNRKMFAKCMFDIGARLCSSGKTAQGIKYFLISFRVFPFNIRPLLIILISLFGGGFYIKAMKLYVEIKKKIINFIINATRGLGYENRT